MFLRRAAEDMLEEQLWVLEFTISEQRLHYIESPINKRMMPEAI
jgi:hypothetical protein